MPPIDHRRIELLEPAMVEVYRNKTPEERVAMVFEAEETLRAMFHAYFQWKHPDWSEEQIQREIARRWLGESARSVTHGD